MRDMLERLQTISEDHEDEESEFNGPEHDGDKVTLSQQAVIFENSSAIDEVLKEAQFIRKEISLLQLEVERMCMQNERFGTSVRRLTLLKKDCDSIAKGVQQRAEVLYVRLQDLGKMSNQLEEKESPNSALSRIARTQYDTLTLAFHAVMSDYSKAEEKQKNTCRRRIQRQASIMGTDITDEQLDVLVDKGGEGWTELSHSLQPQAARTCRLAFCEIKNRHKELVELEARLKEVHELFLQMAVLVEEQGSILNNIEVHMHRTQEHVDQINDHIKKAIQYKKKNPFLQCCPCLPCWRKN
ncbi:syntaxin-11-like [Amphiprion ocellaris]|uniref:t-SNARE coiled-coil homology domain-containing protein n=1 Tax=Amphiprion ocellaris TaxID=80972 RepID=A0A3Q1BUG2_AMPOC|nr:syntaxin-11-like [Amphiprion ocellaris]XP_023135598.1 syntaxin-11-like [Amphiprion ocellaris]XP_054872074.1 syntaxin-11-like [Amphiprion ocellaris]